MVVRDAIRAGLGRPGGLAAELTNVLRRPNEVRMHTLDRGSANWRTYI